MGGQALPIAGRLLCYPVRAMITGYNHTSITVGDMEKMLHFYRDIVGMELVAMLDNRHEGSGAQGSGFEGMHMKVAKLRLGGRFILELIEYVNKKGEKLDTRPTNIGSFHIAFTCVDIMETYGQMVAQGVKFRQAPHVWAGGKEGAVYGFDPDGNRFELTTETKYFA